MATSVNGYSSYILMSDVWGEKAAGKFMSVITGSGPRQQQVMRGELLISIPNKERIPRNDGTPAHSFRSKKDPNITLYGGEEDTNVAPLSRNDLGLLVAIEKPYNRFAVFSETNILDWGGNLRKGDQVYVKLPSASSSVPTWSAAVVKYVGTVETLPGRNFGVEIKEPHYRGRGSTNGDFGGYRYFQCQDDCGIFVSLDKLSPESVNLGPQGAAQQQLMKQGTSSTLPSRPAQQQSASQSQRDISHSIGSTGDGSHRPLKQSPFKFDDRVVVYNKNRFAVHGTVRWVPTKTLKCSHIGIETDTAVYHGSFPNALTTGVSQLFHATPGHRLVVPEDQVFREDLAAGNKQPINLDPSDPETVAREYGLTERQLIVEQKKALKEAEDQKKKEDKARKEEEKRTKTPQTKVPSLVEVKDALVAGFSIAQQLRILGAIEQEKKVKDQAISAPQPRPRGNIQGGAQGVQRQDSKQTSEGIQRQQSGSIGMSELAPSDLRLVEDESGNYEPTHTHSLQLDQNYSEEVKAKESALHQIDLPPHSSNLRVGSRVQLATTEPLIPLRYGVIRWIGAISHIQGQIAGIELEQYMAGCNDGTLPSTGNKYFSCTLGYGLYYPLLNLKADERFTDHQPSIKCQQAIENLLKERDELKQNLSVLERENSLLREQTIVAEKSLEKAQAEIADCKKELATRSIDVWKVSGDRVQTNEQIGIGGWGAVFKGKIEVAVKRLHPAIVNPQNISRIKRELKLLAEVRHPNLVQFIGAVFDQQAGVDRSPPLVITELLDMNLRQAYEQRQLTPKHRLSIFKDVARALDYLHQRYEPIIHRDVSAPNVLLQRLPNNQWKGKVSDLGSANFLQNAQTKGEGAILYSPPEVIPRAYNPSRQRMKQTVKIDVYSYGVLMCEVISSKLPTQDDYYDMIEQVETDWPQMHALIIRCTKEVPDDRPTMANVLIELEGMSLI